MSAMSCIDLTNFEQAGLQREPFFHVVASRFVRAEALKQICASYPRLKGGTYPLENLQISSSLQSLITEMDSPAFEDAMERKFMVSLTGKPKFYSLRGYCRRTDGTIHTDSKDKFITVLVYFHETWAHESGKLRLLRNRYNLNDYAEEVNPSGGTLLAFLRSEKSWHGHYPFEGERRALQMNWMESKFAKEFSGWRHRLSAWLK